MILTILKIDFHGNILLKQNHIINIESFHSFIPQTLNQGFKFIKAVLRLKLFYQPTFIINN